MSVTQESCAKLEPNEWLKIRTESGSLDEFLTATYTRALADDCFKFYRPERSPFVPSGWQEDYARYQSSAAEKKSEVWRVMQEKYKGYLKAKEEAAANTAAHKSFLLEMMAHFKKIGLLSYAEKCRNRIMEFDNAFPVKHDEN